MICRKSADSGNVQQTVTLLSHGGGRWFEPSIVHLSKVLFCRKNVEALVDLIFRTDASTVSSEEEFAIVRRALAGVLVATTLDSTAGCTG